jgi:ferrous iron transport protein B
MDRILRPFGLNGKSIVPLVSGTACAIPAVISTRNIENLKKGCLRFCNAFYDVFCETSGVQYHYRAYYFRRNIFRNKIQSFGFNGNVFLGFLVALFSAAILKRFIKNKGKPIL